MTEGTRAETSIQKDEIVTRLLTVWKKHPELRFMQLLGNVYRGDAYHVEDYPMIEQVEEAYGESDEPAVLPGHPVPLGDWAAVLQPPVHGLG